MNHIITKNQNREIVFSLFDSCKDNVPKGRVANWEGMVDLLCSVPYTDLPKEEQPAWSPALYKEGTIRKNENVALISCLCYDIDNGLHPADTILRLDLEDISYIIYSSYTSTKDHPRWRLVIPLNMPITTKHFKDIYHTAGDWILGAGNYDNCDDPARLWFAPATPKISDAFSHHKDDGYFYTPTIAETAAEEEVEADQDLDAIHLANYLAPDKCYDPSDIWDMLKFTHPDDSHDAWQSTIFALQHNFQHDPDLGLEIAAEWSMQSESFNLREIENIWKRQPVLNPVTIGSLIHRVQEKGYIKPVKIDYGKYKLTTLGMDYFEDNLPEPEWLIQDIMNRNTVAMLAGEGGIGKSMLAMQMACALSSGTDFMGLSCPTDVPVIYLNAEDTRLKFNRRIRSYRQMLMMADILSQHQHDLIAKQLFYYGAENSFARFTRKEIKELVNSINAVTKGQRPVILVDPLITFAEGDENDNKAMGATIDMFRLLRNHTDSSVMFMHHSGKSEGAEYRGASALKDGVRQAYSLKQMTDEERARVTVHDVAEEDWNKYVLLRHTKADEGEIMAPMNLRRVGEGILTKVDAITEEQRAVVAMRDMLEVDTGEEAARMAFVERLVTLISRVGEDGRVLSLSPYVRDANSCRDLLGAGWNDGSQEAKRVRIRLWVDWAAANGFIVREGRRIAIPLSA